MSTIREEVHKMAEKLPPDANWDDVMYEVYVRQKIAEGLRDAEQGRVLSHAEVRERFRAS
jgi:predicted transcriptional regulator